MTVVLSSDVLPELREYERTITTCLQAALMPVLGQYVERLSQQIQARTWRAPLFVMQSSGGIRSAHAAIHKPLSTVLSGPSAAGVGMAWLGVKAGFPDLITLDMGGTSTDVSLVRNGQLQMTTSRHVHGYPLRMPTVDVVSIGAGGGSVAWWGREGRLHVGPRSAGAEPGPVCYGQGGDEVTVTDAHLVLGRLPNALLGGTLALNRAAAEEALAEFGKRKRLGPGEMASGIVQIANHQMCGAVRHISVRRGHDLRDYVLLAMGGAGPLHATELAELLGMSTVLIPPAPGLAAAFGLLVADFRADFVHAFRRRESEIDAARVRQVINALEAQAWTGLAREEIPIAQRQLVRAADFHYVGMSAEWTVPLGGGLVTADAIHQAIEGFHSLFERRCGYSYRGKEEVELINLRVTGIGLLPKPSLPTIATATSDPVPVGRRSVFFLERQGFVDCPIYTRVGLGAGATFTGPAIVEQYDSTTVVSPGWQARVDAFGNLILQR